MLVSQHEQRVEVYARVAQGRWTLSEHEAGTRVALASLGIELGVADVCRGVEWTPGAAT